MVILSRFPYKTPIPSGANILCPENTKKSASNSCTSIFICGILCEASTTTIAPFLCANSMIFFTGLMVPKQKPIQVINAVKNFYEKQNANPHRGAYSLSMEVTQSYENIRIEIPCFIQNCNLCLAFIIN